MGAPKVTPLVEALHDGGFIVECERFRSFDSIVIASGGGKVKAGTVMGKLTTGTSATSAAIGTNTGNGVMGTVTTNTVATQVGVYDLTYTGATTFTVTAPDGDTANGTNGVAFSALGIGFTMTTGGTPMVAGDGFNITVTGAVGKPTAASVAKGGNTGNSTSSAVTTTGYAPKVGVYVLTIIEPATDAGKFELVGPDGVSVGHGNVAAAFSGGGLSFTLADGGTDFASGDQFAITVTAGSNKWAPWNPSAVDGSGTVGGVLVYAKDATSADQAATLLARQATVNPSELIWPTGANAATVTAGLAGLLALGILSAPH